ncbi:MAG: aldo/keto reductase, partial [Pseudomonadota bacterium]
RYPPEWLADPEAENPVMMRAPVPLHETWTAMEKLVEKGLVKRIGVCNYNTALIHDLMAYAKIKPSHLQVEAHPYLTQEKLLGCANIYGIDVTAFSPLGAQSYFELNMAEAGESLLGAAPVMVAAQAHGKTPAQVLLRWGVQRGTSVIPKTTKPERMRENLAIDDFELSSVEMMAINSLNQNRRFNDPGVFTEAAFNTFHPIYD